MSISESKPSITLNPDFFKAIHQVFFSRVKNEQHYHIPSEWSEGLSGRSLTSAQLVEVLAAQGAKEGMHFSLREIGPAAFSDLLSDLSVQALLLPNNCIEGDFVFISHSRGKREFLQFTGETFAPTSANSSSLFAEGVYGPVFTLILAYPLPEAGKAEGHLITDFPTVKRLFNLFRLEKREIVPLIFYALLSGIIGLSLPLGIQSLIGFVSAGQISTSVVVLIFFIISGILVSGIFQVFQITISEYIQQRIFTRTAFDFGFRIPRLEPRVTHGVYLPEKSNRFLDVVSLQKGFAKLLIDFSASLLQILFGLLLLAFYHPYFIVFGILVLGCMVLLVRITGPGGLKTSLKESTYKYKVLSWLQEISRSFRTFKMAGQEHRIMDETDYQTANYLKARRKHFRILSIQYYSFVVFKTLVTAGLLIIGVMLLVSKEINLGQFVASEIIIILIMNAVEKVIFSLDNVYDVLTSLDKLSVFEDLPQENYDAGFMAESLGEGGLSIEFSKVSFRFPDSISNALNSVSFAVQSMERVCIAGFNSSGKHTLASLILGMESPGSGVVLLNGFTISALGRSRILQRSGDNIARDSLFEGTIYENLTFGNTEIPFLEVSKALDITGCSGYIRSMPRGLHTRLGYGGTGLPPGLCQRLVLARCIVNKPSLLIIDDVKVALDRREKFMVYNKIMETQTQATIIFISNEVGLLRKSNRVLVLDQGSLVADGPPQTILENERFKELLQVDI